MGLLFLKTVRLGEKAELPMINLLPKQALLYVQSSVPNLNIKSYIREGLDGGGCLGRRYN